MSKLFSTCPEVYLKNGVIFWSDLILKSFFAICTENLGFRLKLFNKLVNTAFYTSSGKNSGKVFSARIFFPMVNRLSVKSFPTFNRKLPIGCQCCMLRARGNNWGTFLKNMWRYLIILEIERQKLCDFKRKIAGTFLKTAFYVTRGTFWTIWFFETFLFCKYSGEKAVKIQQCCQNFNLRCQRNFWGKTFDLEWFDSWNFCRILNKYFRTLAETIQQSCQSCFQRIKMNNFMRIIFFLE